MTQINYEDEVKRVYPDARAKVKSIGYDNFIAVYTKNNKCLAIENTENEAWRSAYNTIQSQNKEERI